MSSSLVHCHVPGSARSEAANLMSHCHPKLLACLQDEARAALYNSACARARLRQWQEAADDVVRAVNKYGLKFEVAAKVRPARGVWCFYIGVIYRGMPWLQRANQPAACLWTCFRQEDPVTAIVSRSLRHHSVPSSLWSKLTSGPSRPEKRMACPQRKQGLALRSAKRPQPAQHKAWPSASATAVIALHL